MPSLSQDLLVTEVPSPSSPDKPNEPANVSFQQAAEEAQPGFFVEFLEFLTESKSWWLTPIIVVLLIVGVLVFLGSSVFAPFIYPLF